MKSEEKIKSVEVQYVKNFRVFNRNPHPLEIIIKGKHFRWGAFETIVLSEEEYKSSDFSNQIRYFDITEVK